MKNRMRELRSFGSVRGEGSDALAYSENRPDPACRSEVPVLKSVSCDRDLLGLLPRLTPSSPAPI